jgi:hypothetical protein
MPSGGMFDPGPRFTLFGPSGPGFGAGLGSGWTVILGNDYRRTMGCSVVASILPLGSADLTVEVRLTWSTWTSTAPSATMARKTSTLMTA